jgi:hypothetical protein
LGGAAIYIVPSAFVCAMAAGAIAALWQLPLPATEIVIALSVSRVGLAIAIDTRLTWPLVFQGEKDQAVGRFLAVMWENLADPIITGRGEIGQPKLFAEIPELRLADGTYSCEASWMGFKFLDLQVVELDVPDETRPEPQLEGTLMLKYIPRTGAWGEAEICQVSFTPVLTPGLTIESRKAAKGNVTFHHADWRDLPTMYHVVNALAALPVLSSRGASIATTRGGKSYLDQQLLT